MYSLKKEILLVIGTALNIKPTWASHIPTEDPEKGKANSPAPAQSGSLVVLVKRKPAPLCTCGLCRPRRPRWPLASAREVPTHAKPSL